MIAITDKWLSHLAQSAGNGASDADVLLNLATTVSCLNRQGAVSDEATEKLRRRFVAIAKRLVGHGDVVS